MGKTGPRPSLVSSSTRKARLFRVQILRTAVSGSSTSSGRRRGATVVWVIVGYRSFGRFGQARHPPPYAAFLKQPSPSFGHSSAAVVDDQPLAERPGDAVRHRAGDSV